MPSAKTKQTLRVSKNPPPDSGSAYTSASPPSQVKEEDEAWEPEEEKVSQPKNISKG
jgi:hypothetical protein